MSPITKFFASMAGANTDILAQPECQTERSKYASMGLMVMTTGTLALISGGYALFTIFGTAEIAALFGILWGIFIGGLDRFFIISTRKKHIDNIAQLKMAIPRLILAAFIGLIVSKPLEVRIFKSEIELQLAKEKVEEKKRLQNSSTDYQEINNLEQQKQQFRQEEKSLREQWLKAEKQANHEAEGISGTKKFGKGPVYKEKRQQADELLVQLHQKQQGIEDIQVKIDEAKQQFQGVLTDINQKQIQGATLLNHLQTLHNLAEEEPIVGQINFCITLLFILIEISPLTLKLMSKYGPYDQALETFESTMIYQQIEKSEDVKNELKEELKNRQIQRTQLNNFLNNQFSEVIAKTAQSLDLQLAIDNGVKQVVERTEKVIIEQANKVPIDGQQINQQIHNFQPEYIKGVVNGKVKQKQVKSKIEEIFSKDLPNLNNHFADLKTKRPIINK